MLDPIIPKTSAEILEMLGCGTCVSFNEIGISEKFGKIAVGTQLGASRVLFARIDEEKKLAELEAIRQAEIKAAEADQKANSAKKEEQMGLAKIGIEDFMKVELRTAQVIECEKVEKSKKLLKLRVDLGYEHRQVVSGIANFYTPDELIGKKIVLVANLNPAKLCGIESNGMILASGGDTDKVRVIFLSDDTPLGERIR